jgi:hypothetical protein
MCVVGWAKMVDRLQPVRVQREQNASDTRAKRGPNAKSNASLTRSNAGFRGSKVESGAAYVLYLRELRSDRERNQKKQVPVLVNNRLSNCPIKSYQLSAVSFQPADGWPLIADRCGGVISCA